MTTAFEYFMVVVKERSISRAAERLYLSQQNLSNHIKRLEQEYGMLFTRKPKFALTPTGEALFHTLQQISVLEQGFAAQVNEIQNKQYGLLRLGIHAARARAILPKVLTIYRKNFPYVHIDLYLQDTIDDERMLRSGDLDLFLGVDTNRLPEFRYIHLMDEPIYFVSTESVLKRYQVVPQDDIIPLEALNRFPYLLPPPISHFRQKIDRFLETAGINIERTMSVGDFELQLILAAQGEGVCFCAQMMLSKLEQLNRDLLPDTKLQTYRVEHMTATSEISIVLHRLAYRSAILTGFVNAFQQALIPQLH